MSIFVYMFNEKNIYFVNSILYADNNIGKYASRTTLLIMSNVGVE